MIHSLRPGAHTISPPTGDGGRTLGDLPMLCALYALALAVAATTGITPPAPPKACNGGLMDNCAAECNGGWM